MSHLFFRNTFCCITYSLNIQELVKIHHFLVSFIHYIFMTCLYSGGQNVYDAIWMSTKGFLEKPGIMSFLLDKNTDVMLFHLHINFLNGVSSTPSF